MPNRYNMKRYFLILALALIGMSAYANGFSIEKNELRWQLVYPFATPLNDIYRLMLFSNDYRNIQRIDDHTIIAEMKPVKLNVEDYGFKRMKVPLYLVHYKFFPCTIIIETKENRYRATALNIRLTNVSSQFAATGAIEEIENYIFTEGNLNDHLSQYIAPMLGKYLFEALKFEPIEEEEW